MGKSYLVSLLVLLLSFNSFALDTIVISDFDDTVKQTNVQSSRGSIYNGIFTTKMFAGMNDLFSTMDTYTNGLYILSNSPNLLRPKICKLIKKHGLNPLEVSTRNIFRDRDGFEYKYNYVVNKIKKLNTKVILLGDDVGEDPEVYSKVKKDFPEFVSEIYIHKVKNRELPEGVVEYITSFDIAVNEYKNERMNLNQALVLGNLLENEYQLKNIVPKFAYCPKTTNRWDNLNISELSDLISSTAQRIVKYCQRK